MVNPLIWVWHDCSMTDLNRNKCFRYSIMCFLGAQQITWDQWCSTMWHQMCQSPLFNLSWNTIRPKWLPAQSARRSSWLQAQSARRPSGLPAQMARPARVSKSQFTNQQIREPSYTFGTKVWSGPVWSAFGSSAGEGLYSSFEERILKTVIFPMSLVWFDWICSVWFGYNFKSDPIWFQIRLNLISNQIRYDSKSDPIWF